MTKREKKDLDQFITFSVKLGVLDEDEAKKMTYKEKKRYFQWSEVKANS